MTLTTLLYAVDARVATLTVNRPDKLNALNADAKRELREVLEAVKQDAAVDLLVLTGAGDKAFVAGTDIGELRALDSASGRRFAEQGQALFDLIENLGKPVIAAVNGYALGGGCELALACHMRIASEKARFGQPEALLGVIPGYGGTQRLARIVGRGRAMEMILTGVQIDAVEAHRIGLVNKVVPHAELMDRTMQVARAVLANAQPAVRLAMEAVNASEETALSEGMRREASLFGQCCGTEDFREGVRAFLEKRKPSFRGT